jgi:hypothetical protein
MRQLMLRAHAARLLVAAAALLLPASVGALPITYGGSGTILVTATVGTSTVGAGSLTLGAGSSLTFDAGVPQLVNLTFSANPNQGPYALTLPLPFPDYDQIMINTLTVSGGPFTTNLGSGSNPYSVTVAPLTVSGTASLTDTDAPFLSPASGPFGFTNGGLNGTVTVAGNTITLSGIELGTLDLDGAGGLPPIRLKGDVSFTGTLIPEPATALLFGLGLGTLAVARRPRRG